MRCWNGENPPYVDQFLWKLWGVQKVQDCSTSSVSPGWLLKHIRIVHGKSGWAMSCSCWLILAAFPPKCGWLTSIHTGRLEHANVTKMSLLDRCPQNRDALGILGNFHGNINRCHFFAEQPVPWCGAAGSFKVYEFVVNHCGCVYCSLAKLFPLEAILGHPCHRVLGGQPLQRSITLLRMHAAIGAGRLLVRVSMCLLHSFAQVFGEQVLCLVKSCVSRHETVTVRIARATGPKTLKWHTLGTGKHRRPKFRST